LENQDIVQGTTLGLCGAWPFVGTYSWTEKWLSTLDELWHHAKTTDLDMQVPDFLFPVMRHDGIELP